MAGKKKIEATAVDRRIRDSLTDHNPVPIKGIHLTLRTINNTEQALCLPAAVLPHRQQINVDCGECFYAAVIFS
jgi:hypothetical protein